MRQDGEAAHFLCVLWNIGTYSRPIELTHHLSRPSLHVSWTIHVVVFFRCGTLCHQSAPWLYGYLRAIFGPFSHNIIIIRGLYVDLLAHSISLASDKLIDL